MVVRNLLDLMEPLTDTLERLPEETEVETLRIYDTRYDVLATVELFPEDKPGEAICYAAQFLREKVHQEAAEHPVGRQAAVKRFFLHNVGAAFIEFCEFEPLKTAPAPSRRGRRGTRV